MRYKNEIMPKTTEKKISPKRNKLHKCHTGIKGFDEITEGGLPKNRISLICGSTGSGKTLFGIDFLINGVINYNEPGLSLIHISEPTRLLSISYAVFCLKKKK